LFCFGFAFFFFFLPLFFVLVFIFLRQQSAGPRQRNARRSVDVENSGSVRKEKREREGAVDDRQDVSSTMAGVVASDLVETSIAKALAKSFKGLREIQRLSSESFDGKYWTSPGSRSRSSSSVSASWEALWGKGEEEEHVSVQGEEEKDKVEDIVAEQANVESSENEKKKRKKRFNSLREIQRLGLDNFDGKYWMSPPCRSGGSLSGSSSPPQWSQETFFKVEEEEHDMIEKDELKIERVDAVLEGGREELAGEEIRRVFEQASLAEEAVEEIEVDEVFEQVSLASDCFDGASYLHSEAARLYAARNVGTIVVPDLNGQISMDGDYWKISGSGRNRRQRELQFFPPTLKLGSTLTGPRPPRAPLSPGTIERRRREQQRVASEVRAEKEQREAAYADLVVFESTGREVVKGLFLSGVVAAENVNWVIGSVDFVINASGKIQPYMQVMAADNVMRIDEGDNEHSNLFQYFVPVAERIDNLLQNGRKVLVHCHQGKSRSAALVAAYLVREGIFKRKLSDLSSFHRF
jgi:hypothetical protein